MNKISSFTITNSNTFNYPYIPVNVAVPFPKGLISNPQKIKIKDNTNDQILKSSSIVTGKWHDKSIKWLNVEFITDIPSSSTKTFDVIEEATTSQDTIDTTNIFDIVDIKLNTLGKINLLGTERALNITSTLSDDKQLDFNLISEQILQNDSIKTVRELHFKGEGCTPLIELLIRVHEYNSIKTVKIDAVIKNLSSANHYSEFWDLNDGGSLFFKNLSVEISLNKNDKATFSTDSSFPPEKSFSDKDFRLLQQSSGGEKWNCKNHLSAEDKIYRVVKGGIIEAEGESREKRRLSPTVYVESENNDCILAISQPEFWQNFPSALSKKHNTISIGLFPDNYDEIYELQGGEQKKQSFWIKENSDDPNMKWIHSPLVPIFSPQWHEKCCIYPYMTSPDESDPKEYFDLIDNCINDKNSFANRREEIDEYGWRNYGELYADHESSYLKNGEYNISHYNNQYDFANYAMIQFWRSSDKRWYNLAQQLARHVRDIDTYHTTLDRFNFNGGIFWHTNHYVSAETATHRCYSAKAEPPVAGGISIQNCYIAGLMTHYYTSADIDTYNSVIETLNYAYKLVMGPEDFKSNVKYFTKETIKNFYYSTKSKITKQVFPYGLFQGPGRESGNALLILTKAFEFTEDRKYLKAAERIMKKCISPRQNLKAMRIKEPEYRWMYLLFLQSMIEYMKVKEEIGEIDKCYRYAVKSFKHYTEWMLKNEYSYLDKPETLEYPNETWAMQELRKPHILYEASQRTEDIKKKEQYTKMADKLYKKAFKHYGEYGDRQLLTRPLVLAVAYGLIPIFFKKKR